MATTAIKLKMNKFTEHIDIDIDINIDTDADTEIDKKMKNQSKSATRTIFFFYRKLRWCCVYQLFVDAHLSM